MDVGVVVVVVVVVMLISVTSAAHIGMKIALVSLGHISEDCVSSV